MTVRQPTVVEHLQQHVEHVGVCLLDLIEQHDRVRPAADSLGQLAAVVMADVPGGCADQAADRVPFQILRHVDPNHGAFVVEQRFGQRTGQLGLADTGRTQEQETPDGPIRLAQPGAAAPDGIGDRCDRTLLADDSASQRLFQVHQLVHLSFEQPPRGDARPARHHLGDVVRIYLFPQDPLACLQSCQLPGCFIEMPVHLWQFTEADLRGLPKIGFALHLGSQCLGFGLQRPDPVDRRLLRLPVRLEPPNTLALRCEFLRDRVAPLVLVPLASR